MNDKKNLDTEHILSLFRPGGALESSLKNFETREQQQQMVADIIKTYNDNSISLIEAGTGTGKSLAYLIPAILWSLENNERTVISTNTINLQEQLIHKDIPFIKKALNIDIKAALVKGMANYVCMRKLDDIAEEAGYFSEEDQNEVLKIQHWAETTRRGSRSDLSYVPQYHIWEKVCAEGDACPFKKCPYYERCFFFKARNYASDAKILVVNHSLLFSDLAMRYEAKDYTISAILPSYKHLVLDEAHNVEHVATEQLSCGVSSFDMLKVLSKLSTERHEHSFGKLYFLRECIKKEYPNDAMPTEIQDIMVMIESDIAAARRRIHSTIKSAFGGCSAYFSMQAIHKGEDGDLGGKKIRFTEEHATSKYWQGEVLPHIKRLVDELRRYIATVSSLQRKIEETENKNLIGKLETIFLDVNSMTNRLERLCKSCEAFALGEDYETMVRWGEVKKRRGKDDITLVTAHLDISELMARMLFTEMGSVLLCSATLSTNKNFKFIRQRLGITEKYLGEGKIYESIYDSPFDFERRMLFVAPRDIPAPDSKDFFNEMREKIWETVTASRGNAFVLFTSFAMLNMCYNQLQQRFADKGYTVFKQGEAQRQNLIARFRETERSILFGTNSFWEGVDVAGDALRCVVIVKLPFQVPTEPIIQARTEAILRRGGNPFFEYTVPTAIVKFKQGVGRLIRNKKDRGCIVCLDSRVLTKSYGKFFLNSLPACDRTFESGKALERQMKDFYVRTQ
jgi:ATP-dependent DNA helicase DinG